MPPLSLEHLNLPSSRPRVGTMGMSDPAARLSATHTFSGQHCPAVIQQPQSTQSAHSPETLGRRWVVPVRPQATNGSAAMNGSIEPRWMSSPSSPGSPASPRLYEPSTPGSPRISMGDALSSPTSPSSPRRLMPDQMPVHSSSAFLSARPSVPQLASKELFSKPVVGTQDGGIGALLKICRAGTPGGKERALTALVNLALANAENRQQIADQGGIGVATELSRSGNAGVKESATILLAILGRAGKAETKDVKLVGWMNGQRPTNPSTISTRSNTPRTDSTVPLASGDAWTSQAQLKILDNLSDLKKQYMHLESLLKPQQEHPLLARLRSPNHSGMSNGDGTPVHLSAADEFSQWA